MPTYDLSYLRRFVVLAFFVTSPGFANTNPNPPSTSDLTPTVQDTSSLFPSQDQIDEGVKQSNITHCIQSTLGFGMGRLSDNITACTFRSGPSNICQTVAHGLTSKMQSEVNTCCQATTSSWACSARARMVADEINAVNPAAPAEPVAEFGEDPTNNTGQIVIPGTTSPTVIVGSTTPP